MTERNSAYRLARPSARDAASRPDVHVARLKRDAHEKWSYILEDLAPQLRQALAEAGEHGPCPVHGGSDGFRLFRDYAANGAGVCNTCGSFGDGFRLLAWVKGYSIADAVAEVGRWLGGHKDPAELSRRKPPAPVRAKDPVKAQARLNEVWKEAQELKGSAAEAYLAHRGIYAENMPHSLRSHPGLPYWDGKARKMLGTFPCLLAPIRDKEGALVSIHRIFLTPEGQKAPVPAPKKMMESPHDLSGSAIKLWPAGEVLGVAEGIETALAAHAITRIPVWSCVSAVLLEQVAVPGATRHVVVFADKDRSYRGQQAGEALAERLVGEGKTVEVLTPVHPIPEGEKGLDWLDVLTRYGQEGFPPRWRNWRGPRH